MAWRLPAEWEPQEAIWLVWPRDPLTWPDRIDAARAAIAAAARAIGPQTVHLIVHPEAAASAASMTGDMAHVERHKLVHQDSWIRDYGPITLVHAGRQRLLKFHFDAWGEKYESLMADDDVVPRLTDAGLLPTAEVIDFVLEGGALETDGHGTFLATRSVCEGRNQMPEDFEDMLRAHLAAKHVIWLDEGIEGDDTDGHIDTITRFVAPRTVVTATAPKGHPDHASLAANLAVLRASKDAQGKPLKVYPLPAPPRQETDDGMPLPAGYANFLITQHAVLVPTYGAPSDAEAMDAIGTHFPDRRIEGIDHSALIWGMGGIHCLSMQIPKA